MKQWSLTLHGPSGILSTLDSGETQFVIGTEEAADVFTITGDDVAARHSWVWIANERMQVEDLGEGTLIKGHPITERVEVEYPASVQVGSVTLGRGREGRGGDHSSATGIEEFVQREHGGDPRNTARAAGSCQPRTNGFKKGGNAVCVHSRA